MPKLTRITIFGIRLATIVLVIYWIALFTGTHMPSPPDVGVKVSDKTQHFTAFFGLATLLYWVIPAKRGVGRKLAVVLAVAVTYAAFDEWTQRFSPRRHVDFQDFLTNLGGILTATACYLLTRALWLRLRHQPASAQPAPAQPASAQPAPAAPTSAASSPPLVHPPLAENIHDALAESRPADQR